jgi:predicted nuclease of restriction endonuclease-like (RecB) superfamily
MDKIYLQFIQELKRNILQSRYIAARLANREQLLLYYKTGNMLSEKIITEKWGTKVIQQVSDDLQKEMPGLRGFSYRNLKNMRQFFEIYKDFPVLQSATAKLQAIENQQVKIRQSPTAQFISSETSKSDLFFNLSFTHHLLLISKCPNLEERQFYMLEAARQFWSVTILEHQIESGLYKNQGKLPNNFNGTISETLQPTALQIFKDEYLVDFMDLNEQGDEKELETGIVSNIKDFILRMGKGFSFIGNQYRIELDGEEFFIDLLFFNRHLQALVVYELKRGKFKPAYAGQLNFYLNVLDEKVKLPHENSSIGIILCKEKNNTVVEFSVRSIDKAMGVATYKTSKQVPDEMKGILPDTDEMANLL